MVGKTRFRPILIRAKSGTLFIKSKYLTERSRKISKPHGTGLKLLYGSVISERYDNFSHNLPA